MKKICLFLFMVVLSFLSFGQDYIYKSDGQKITAKILEKNDRFITYQLHNTRNNEAIQIPNSQVFMINYENGRIEIINESSGSVTVRENNFRASDIFNPSSTLRLQQENQIHQSRWQEQIIPLIIL